MHCPLFQPESSVSDPDLVRYGIICRIRVYWEKVRNKIFNWKMNFLLYINVSLCWKLYNLLVSILSKTLELLNQYVLQSQFLKLLYDCKFFLFDFVKKFDFDPDPE